MQTTLCLEQTAAAMADLPIGKVIACHCTGEAALETLRSVLGSKVVRGEAGSTYAF